MKAIQFIQLTPEQLQDKILQGVKEELNLLKRDFRPKEPTVYLTRNELADLLKIDLSTVHNWTRKGKLVSYGIGSRVYYKRDEVERALIRLK